MTAPANMPMKIGDDIPRVTALPSHDVRVGGQILERHFLESLHQDILNAVGRTLDTDPAKKKRDPAFRLRILKAYE